MKESQYYVIDIDCQIIGPVDAPILTHLVTKWQIGPDSPIRRGSNGDWMSFRDVAATLDITLPDSGDWRANRKATVSKERSDMRWGCAVFLVIGWIGMAWIGLGFLVVPMLMTGILFVLFCKLFGAISSTDVLNVPMWSDVRVKPLPGQGLQMLAFALSLGMVIGYYYWRITNS